MPEIVKSGFQCSWLAHILEKPEPIVLKSQDPEVIHFQDKLQVNIEYHKLTIKVVRKNDARTTYGNLKEARGNGKEAR